MSKAILGKKLGMTQVFTAEGQLVPVTVVETTPSVVVRVKTVETDGYEAVQVGFDDKREVLSNKPAKGHVAKANTAPKRFIKEFRYDEMMSYEVGDKITVDSFVAGEVVDVTGTSKGKGYQGVIKRHGQHIGPKGHGSGAHRIVGSMGPIAPNRIAPGKKLPGQMGHVTRTIQNLEVVAVDPENNLLLIKGSVPGPKKGLVVVKTAIKKVEVAVVNKDKETAVNALVNVNIGVSCFIDRDRLRRAILRAEMTFLAHIAFNRRGADVSRIIDRFFRIIIGQTAVFH